MQNHQTSDPRITKLQPISLAEVKKIHGYKGWVAGKFSPPKAKFYHPKNYMDENSSGCRYSPIIQN